MKRTCWLMSLCLVLLALCASILSAQGLAWDAKEFMGLNEIQSGMKGYGKTVYEGTKVEKFDVEVIGVLNKLDFGFDMILIKVTSGPVIDRKLQTVAGMSGSPIYINDRLIGAYAYGWDFQQEAVAGVTPIASMMEVTQPGAVTPPLVGSLAPAKGVLKIGDRLITRVQVVGNAGDAAQLQAKADPTTMVLCPVSTPLFVSGIGDKGLKPLQKLLDRYNIRAQAGPGMVDGPAPQLEAGSAVAVSLMEGDANLSAVGTVTYVKGNTVLAFGHPFLGLGKVDMPMSAAYVHGIINSAQSSFKMASPMGRVGALTSDRQYAVGGTIGQQPNLLPVSLFLTDQARNFTRRYAVEMMNNPDFTPYILYLYVLANGASQMGDLSWDQGTFAARMMVDTDKFGKIEQNLVVAPQASASFLPMGELYMLTDALMQNPYEPVAVKNVFIDLKYTPERNIATIEKVTANRMVARPGETVEFAVKIRPYGKPVETRTVTMKVPEYATEPAMIAVVAGGANGMMLKPLTAPIPTPEEGVQGLVRWITNNPPTQSLLTAQVLPSPSYGYRGRMLRDLPDPISDLLSSAASSGAVRQAAMPGANQQGGEEGGAPNANLRPTTYLASEPMPYVLTGGQMVLIAIATEESAVQRMPDFDFGLEAPVLSASLLPQSRNAAGDDNAEYAGSWLTPQQRTRFAMLRESFVTPTTPAPLMALPSLRLPSFLQLTPLSLAMNTRGRDINVEAKPNLPTGTAEEEGDTEDDEEVSDEGDDDEVIAEESGDVEDADTEEDADGAQDNVLLSKKVYSWGLVDGKDFMRGKHLGTSVTSKGALVLTPKVSTFFQATEMVPTKMAVTPSGTYLAGWDSKQVLRLDAAGKSEVIFPKAAMPGVEAVTALAADAAGNILIGTWPDQRLRLLKPDGSVIREWYVPGANIWDVAIATDGKRYAACDEGAVYLLKDDANVPVQVACTVPDKHAFTLAAGPKGEMYLATFPRGKVYKITPDGQLSSIWEGQGAVTALVADATGNLYVGMSPTCRVYRIAPDGSAQQIMRGMGRGNRHVLALALSGNDLYAGTGPVGGIYRISNPTTQQPEVTAIYARQDLRTGAETNGNGQVGPESVMVTALAQGSNGTLLAAAAAPGQVLKLEPRTEGSFLSTVLQTPTVARWGNMDVHARTAAGTKVAIETRSGHTALPDKTWNEWQPLNGTGAEMASAPATFAQFRVQMVGTANVSPVFEYARLNYQPMNQPPAVQIAAPKPGMFVKGTAQFRWEAKDPDEDELVYTVFVSNDDGNTWTQLSRTEDPKPEAAPVPAPEQDKKKRGNAKEETEETAAPAAQPKVISEVTEKSIPWDSTSQKDGAFRFKVIASDMYAHPNDPKAAEAISGRFIVDNTTPKIEVDDKVFGWEKLSTLRVSDNLTPIMGGKYRIADGPWVALVPADGVFNSRQESITLMSPKGAVDLVKGEYPVIIQVKDAAGNLTERTVTLMIGEKAPEQVTKVDIPPVREADEKVLAEFLFLALKEN